MPSSVLGIITDNDQDPKPYFASCGVPDLAFEEIEYRAAISTYSTMGLFLIAEDVAATWYQNMLKGPAAQSKWGSIEAQCNCGLKIAPYVTWDTKGTTLLAMMGGLVNNVKQRLEVE